jgi:hypothetical protein
MRYQWVMVGDVGLFYIAGKLCNLTQKIVGKHSNKSAGSAFRTFHFRSSACGGLRSTSFEERPDGLETSKRRAKWSDAEPVYRVNLSV